MKITINNRWTGNAQHECELDASFDTQSRSSQLGATVKLAYKSGAGLSGAGLSDANLSGADLCGADLRDAYLSDANLSGEKIEAMRVFTGLYQYQVWAVLFKDGSRWVRMGCSFKSIKEWEEIGIRKSNVSEFPDDGTARCEERVAAFEYAKAAAMRMKAEECNAAQI